ncbi:hypothetical protein ACLOJK_002181 [Asimina triloba]
MAENPHCSSMALAFVLLLLLLRPTLAEDDEKLPVDTEPAGHGGSGGAESVEGMFGDYPEGPLPDYVFPPLGDIPGFVEPPGGLPPLPPLPPGASYILPPLAELEAAADEEAAREEELATRQDEELQGKKNASQATKPSLLLLAAVSYLMLIALFMDEEGILRML